MDWIISPPTEITFHCKDSTGPTELSDDLTLRYRQLVAWCMIQCYRYWVLDDAGIPDHEYDQVEGYLRYLEQELPYELEEAAMQRSPTVRIYGVNEGMYPYWVRALFIGCDKRTRRQPNVGLDRLLIVPASPALNKPCPVPKLVFRKSSAST